MQADQRLAGGDEVAVLDEPLDDLAAVRRATLDRGRARLATSPIGGAGREHARRRRPRRSGGRCPWRARRPSARSGVVSITEASPCLSQNARASSSWSGVLRAKVSTPLQRPLGDAGQGAGRRHLEDAGDAEVGHRLHAEVPAHRAGDLADDPARAPRGRRGRPGRRGWRSRGVRGSWVETERASVAEVADGGRHVLGVEGAGDAQRDQPGLGRRVVGQRLRAARACRRRRSGRGRCRWRRSGRASSSAASTSSRSPPRTAVMPVGVVARRPRPSPCRARGPAPSPARR